MEENKDLATIIQVFMIVLIFYSNVLFLFLNYIVWLLKSKMTVFLESTPANGNCAFEMEYAKGVNFICAIKNGCFYINLALKPIDVCQKVGVAAGLEKVVVFEAAIIATLLFCVLILGAEVVV